MYVSWNRPDMSMSPFAVFNYYLCVASAAVKFKAATARPFPADLFSRVFEFVCLFSATGLANSLRSGMSARGLPWPAGVGRRSHCRRRASQVLPDGAELLDVQDTPCLAILRSSLLH